MLEITVDTEALLARIKAMEAKIAHVKAVDLGQIMSEWQLDDMHRKRPFTMRYRKAGKVQTTVRPHSLYEMLKSEGIAVGRGERARMVRAVRKHLKHPIQRWRVKYREHRHWSVRPILRAFLDERLMERMRVMIEEKLTWA